MKYSKEQRGRNKARNPLKQTNVNDIVRGDTRKRNAKPGDRIESVKKWEPWTQRPLFVTLDGETRKVSHDIEGLPRAVVVAIKRNKAMVISPARYSKETGGQYIKRDIRMNDGSVYSVTLTYPTVWVRAPGDRERALVWALRETGSITRPGSTGDLLIIPKDRSGQRAWVPKEDSKTNRNQRVAREAFKAYPVSTLGLVEYLQDELGVSNSPFEGISRCRSSWLLLTETNHAIDAWMKDDRVLKGELEPFYFKWRSDIQFELDSEVITPEDQERRRRRNERYLTGIDFEELDKGIAKLDANLKAIDRAARKEHMEEE